MTTLDEATFERVEQLPRSADEHVAWIRERVGAEDRAQAVGSRWSLTLHGHVRRSSTQGCR